MYAKEEEEAACFQMALGMSRVAKCTKNKQAMHLTSCSPINHLRKMQCMQNTTALQITNV
jgi:hypothetical protein